MYPYVSHSTIIIIHISHNAESESESEILFNIICVITISIK